MQRIYLLKDLYYFLWLSPDAELLLNKQFPSEMKVLKRNENAIPTEAIAKMVFALKNCSIFS